MFKNPWRGPWDALPVRYPLRHPDIRTRRTLFYRSVFAPVRFEQTLTRKIPLPQENATVAFGAGADGKEDLPQDVSPNDWCAC